MNEKNPAEYDHELNADFWNQRWKSGQTGWDIGYASPPIISFMMQYPDKKASILIPGCGNAYEAEKLAAMGFSDITLIDISEELVLRLREKFINTPQIKVMNGDFFRHQGRYDLVLEQTFFCAQVIERRQEYVSQIAALLNDGGMLAGVLFGVDFGKDGPPFGGNADTYRTLFGTYFNIKKLEPCYNSIPARAGSELFILFEKK
ncbi:MAG: methyltransferase domain-containing protein [Saprospiraceae bacterium]|nr:methyltransferase domain-containing protein [Saprospiraceae bacterium]